VFYAGIDAGSRMIKIVLVNGKGLVVAAKGLIDQGVEQAALAGQLLEEVLLTNGIAREDIDGIVATGYGRGSIDWADTAVTEITCHARGVKYQEPAVRTIIDIGGQDNKLVRLDADGGVRDFLMNDRCAAGTGRFLEVVAERLEVELGDLGDFAGKALSPSVISSMCVVFAETEIISLLASGEAPENIAAGVQTSIAKRIASMSGGKVASKVIFTGGAALVPGMKEALENAVDCEIVVAQDPQFTGALGASLIAAKEYNRPGGQIGMAGNTGTYCDVRL
jgi:(R)-2-hydroxyacyl-CoA dehydratese activating ATPase